MAERGRTDRQRDRTAVSISALKTVEHASMNSIGSRFHASDAERENALSSIFCLALCTTCTVSEVTRDLEFSSLATMTSSVFLLKINSSNDKPLNSVQACIVSS